MKRVLPLNPRPTRQNYLRKEAWAPTFFCPSPGCEFAAEKAKDQVGAWVAGAGRGRAWTSFLSRQRRPRQVVQADIFVCCGRCKSASSARLAAHAIASSVIRAGTAKTPAKRLKRRKT